MRKSSKKAKELPDAGATLLGLGVYGPRKTSVTLAELEEMTRKLEEMNAQDR